MEGLRISSKSINDNWLFVCGTIVHPKYYPMQIGKRGVLGKREKLFCAKNGVVSKVYGYFLQKH